MRAARHSVENVFSSCRKLLVLKATMGKGWSQRDDASSLLRDIGSDADPDGVSDGPCGAILGIDAGADVGEDGLEALIGCARCRLAFEHDPAVVADQLEGGVELVDLPSGIAIDLNELVDQAFLDDDVELVGRWRSAAAAGVLEDELVAHPLPDTARNRRHVDAGHDSAEPRTASGRAVKRLDAAPGQAKRRGHSQSRKQWPKPPH